MLRSGQGPPDGRLGEFSPEATWDLASFPLTKRLLFAPSCQESTVWSMERDASPSAGGLVFFCQWCDISSAAWHLHRASNPCLLVSKHGVQRELERITAQTRNQGTGEDSAPRGRCSIRASKRHCATEGGKSGESLRRSGKRKNTSVGKRCCSVGMTKAIALSHSFPAVFFLQSGCPIGTGQYPQLWYTCS